MNRRRRLLKWGLRLAILAAGVALPAALLFDAGILRFNHPSRSRFPVRGIDVSHHQGKIDWPRLRREGIGFAFIKATEGGDFRDSLFFDNWEGAARAGIVRGAYHYFTFCRSGEEQAANFIGAVPPAEYLGALPPAVDVEYGGNCQDAAPEREVVLAELADFLDRLEAAYGRRPIVYSTEEAYDDFLARELPGTAIWIRDIYWQPSLSDDRPWTFWQYANRGRLPGIDGFVDLNVYRGGWDQFRRQLLAKPERL